MRAREETRQAVAEILKEVRASMHLSRAKMADLMNIDERTLARYESGESAPSVPEFIDLLQVTGAPALQLILKYIFPDRCPAPGSTIEETEAAIINFIKNDLADKQVLQLSYLLFGAHGSPISSLLDLISALVHMPIESRLIIAKLTLASWELEEARGNLINQDNSMPDTDALRQTLIQAHNAVVEGRKSYNNMVK